MLKPFLQPQEPPQRTILTVSQLNQQAKSCLEKNIGSIWLNGEISNLTKAVSGHWYFSLKDDSAQIRCAMFRFKTQTLKFVPKEGDQVVVKGKISLYEARGEYQLIVDYMEPAGLGDLQQRLRLLIEKFTQEGLFAVERKKKLPKMPRTIGVITSATGAAVHDVLNVLKRRCPMIPVIIYPTQVQGNNASKQIITALEYAQKRQECDVLIITRGGGSLEDLWCFNDEILARKIAACNIPTVAAIGHEVDTSIAELIADLRAPTPSAAAELVAPERANLEQQIDYLSIKLLQLLQQKLDTLKNKLNVASLKISDPKTAILTNQNKLEKTQAKLKALILAAINQNQQKLKHIESDFNRHNPITQLKNNQQKLSRLDYRLKTAWFKTFELKNKRLAVTASTLNTLSPLSTLNRGYAIVKQKGSNKLIRQTSQVKTNDSLEIMLADGSINCRVL